MNASVGALSRTVYPSDTYGLPPRCRPATQAQLAWPNKRTGEALDYSADFTAALDDTTDTLQSASASIVATIGSALGFVWGGSYAAGGGPVPLVVTATSVAGNIVTLMLSGGTPGSTYIVTVTATSAAGRILVAPVSLYVEFA